MNTTELEVIRETEAQLLGCLLIAGSDGDTEPIEAVRKIITIRDFVVYHGGLHRRIFQAMLFAGKTDQITVANQMLEDGTLERGDLSYMSELVANAITSLDAEHFAGLVAENARRWHGDTRSKPRFTGVI